MPLREEEPRSRPSTPNTLWFRAVKLVFSLLSTM